jgi:hypothetical protein
LKSTTVSLQWYKIECNIKKNNRFDGYFLVFSILLLINELNILNSSSS